MIKFVYFDVGGVLIKDFSASKKWNEIESDLGIAKDSSRFMKFWDYYEKEVCIGRDVETLLPLIGEKFKTKIPLGYRLLTDGFVNRFDKNETIWPIVEKVKKTAKTGLLTNMYPNMLDEIFKAGLMLDVGWDVIIDSSIEKVRKPQVEIFQLAQDRSGCRGKEILFVENSAKHVEAARQFGWQAFLYDPTDLTGSTKKLNTALTKSWRAVA